MRASATCHMFYSSPSADTDNYDDALFAQFDASWLCLGFRVRGLGFRAFQLWPALACIHPRIQNKS